MGIVRRPFIWKNPVSGKSHHIWNTPDLVNLLTDVIEDPEEAEDFFEKYKAVAPKDLAEQNIAYHILLVDDPDIQEDLLELFLINPKDHLQEKDGAIRPEQLFQTKHGSSSLGLLKDTSELKVKKAVKSAR